MVVPVVVPQPHLGCVLLEEGGQSGLQNAQLLHTGGLHPEYGYCQLNVNRQRGSTKSELSLNNLIKMSTFYISYLLIKRLDLFIIYAIVTGYDKCYIQGDSHIPSPTPW